MQHDGVKVVSLNVNGLSSPIKRGKIMAKFKREKNQVIFLQETHLSTKEHEKLKRYGYYNTFYSTYHKHNNRRGVAILITNSTKFELEQEKCDKEGRYIMVKGKLEGQRVTLINVYAPPDSKKALFKTLFDLITVELQGILICAGDWNIVLNYNLDTTSKKKNRAWLNRYMNMQLSDLGLIDVWRDRHPLERDYTHFSDPHQMYSRLDYFFMTKGDMYRVKDCRIGVADLSDHNAIYLTIKLNTRRRTTVWRMNVGILNDKHLVERTKEDIKRYIEDNDNGEVDPTILWDALKAVIRGKLMAYTSSCKVARLLHYETLIGRLKDLEQKHNTKGDPEVLKQLKETKTKIDNILLTEVEKKARFVKLTYYEGGAKASRLLARRIRKQQALNNIYKIRDPQTNDLITDPGGIERVFRDYYQNLYTPPAMADKKDIRNFLDGLDLPSIGEEQNDLLTAEITEEEMERAISRMKGNKSPGSDGFPSEFYKTFRQELSPVLLASFRYTIEKGKIPPSWREAIITTIPKEGKDKEQCSSYRPISVLNVDYKMYTSIISKRFETFMTDIIDEDQTGFIKGRQTQDNIRRMMHIVEETQRTRKGTTLVSVDAKAAFDSTSWTYLYMVLERFGFNEKSVNCIKALYQEPTARIKVNGSLTKPFYLKRGTRQGCSLSPTLFAIFIEPLAQAIRQDQDIRGVEVKGEEHKIGLFADDVVAYLTHPSKSFPALMNQLEEYGYYSGYKLNVDKTQILAMYYAPTPELKDKYKIKWNSETIKYLGVNITKGVEKLYTANYTQINEELRRDIARWSMLQLDLSSRIEIIKMNVLPRLLYLFQTLPVMIPQKQFIEWDRQISRFIWAGRRPRIRYRTMQLPKVKGGMAVPKLQDYFYAAQLRAVFCWCNGKYIARWKDIEMKEQASPLQVLITDRELFKREETMLGSISKFTLEIWHLVINKYNLQTEAKILRWLSHDKRFKPGVNDQGFESWAQRGITAMCTLLERGELQSFQALREKFGLDARELYRYFQVRDYYIKEIKLKEPREQNGIIKVIINAYEGRTCRVISALYQALGASGGYSTTYVKEKWEKELDIEITEENWNNVCKAQQSATGSRIWREFGWKNIIRFFITPKITGRYTPEKSSCWRLCGQKEADHAHVFWQCQKIEDYWEGVWKKLKEILGYEIQKTPLVLYLGYIPEDEVQGEDTYLLKVLLAASRKAVTRAWLKVDPPTQEDWLSTVEEIYSMEKFSHCLKMREELFGRKWVKWLWYKNKDDTTEQIIDE